MGRRLRGGGRGVGIAEPRLSWRDVFDALPDAAVLVDREGRIHDVNRRLAALSGYRHEDLVGRSIQVLVPPRHHAKQEEYLNDYLRNPRLERMDDLDIALLCRDGSEVDIDVALSPLEMDSESWVVAVVRDQRVRRAALEARLEAERRFRVAFENNMAPMVLADAEDRMTAANEAFFNMVGFTADELYGNDTLNFTHPHDVGVTEATLERARRGETQPMRYVKRYLRKDGRTIFSEVSRSTVLAEDGNISYFVFSERDITEERFLNERLSHQALHDPLTGLANRALFEDRLAQAQARTLRHGGLGAVLLLDLDDFKEVNDTQGHLVGDQLLVEIARRLEQVTRSMDTLCRFGGDEFLYLAEGLTSQQEAVEITRRLLDVLHEPFVVAGNSVEQRASVGVVVWDEARAHCMELVQDADVALFEAKRRGKGQFVVFTSAMHEQVVSRYTLLHDLRHALAAGELTMHYQPIVALASGEVVGFEALMRWHHPELGWVSPGEFIALAEQSELIVELGSFALKEAASAVGTWAVAGAQRPFVAVNLSPRQFLDPGLASTISDVLRECGLAPDRLVVEITEGAALADIDETLRVIDHLGRLGVAFALDDFGTGYSSLAYLTALKPRVVKIDRSFVMLAGRSERDDALLEAITTLGHRLGSIMLAEGIETPAQLARLRDFDCDLGQGFFFASAVPSNEARGLLERGYDAAKRELRDVGDVDS